MKQFQRELKFHTKTKSFLNISDEIQKCVADAKIVTGLCTLFVRHTSASLLIQENADPDVLSDFSSFFSKLVPENASYRHHDEGPDDMPGHIRTALTRTSENIPIAQSKLVLGRWQAVYLWEHRAMGHERSVVVHIVGE